MNHNTMNPSTTHPAARWLRSFVDDLHPEDLVAHKGIAIGFLDKADAALEEAEMALKYGGSVNGGTSPADLETQVRARKLAVSACETLIHAIQSRITSLRLEGKAPGPTTFTSNISTHYSV